METIESLAEVFKAFSDPTRLKLLKLLGEKKGEYCVNALTRMLDVTQSAVSQHLRILRHVGLVNSRRNGLHIHYSLNNEMLKDVKKSMSTILGKELNLL